MWPHTLDHTAVLKRRTFPMVCCSHNTIENLKAASGQAEREASENDDVKLVGF